MSTFGIDTQCITDLTRVDILVTDPRQVIGQRVARRWQTPRGALAAIGDDPNFGWDVTQYINRRMGPSDISAAQNALLFEALKDEEVHSGTVDITLTNDGSLTIVGALNSSAGPFVLTIGVGQLSSSLVFNFEPQ